LSLEIIRGIENFTDRKDPVVATIGTFDGVHLGHQAILKRVAAAALIGNMQPVAITFEPHPRVLVTPDSPPLLLTCLNEKIRLFSQFFDGTLLILKFDKDLMNLTAERFAEKYLVEKINLGRLIVGYDHAFGKGRSGTINDLMGLSRKHHFELEIVDPVIVDGRPISSTRIRRLIAEHKLSQAVDLLGHPYPLSGKVIKGIMLGKKIGFPTANIEYSRRKLLPQDGVYSCHIEFGSNRHDGMLFIGHNNFNPKGDRSVEVNIFDFDGEIYGEELFCYPEVFIRENRKYEETSQLVEQLKHDKKRVLMLKK
jgi:riboflavin kinase/FMN adenylyltransferase